MWTNNNSLDELITGVMKNGPNILEHCQTDANIQNYINRVLQEHLDYPIPPKNIDKNNWFIPEPYKDMVIESWLLYQCKTQEETDRVTMELELYKQHGMIPVLNTMKYIVDTLRHNNIVWGVGRGSSVASYVLYLIGVHKINSIKYSIPIEEFFKGENNG
jgi:DNA polymerase III alpha subunit